MSLACEKPKWGFLGAFRVIGQEFFLLDFDSF